MNTNNNNVSVSTEVERLEKAAEEAEAAEAAEEEDSAAAEE